MTLEVDQFHILKGVKRVPIAGDMTTGGREMRTRRCSVIHFTAGQTGISSIGYWREPKQRKNDIGAHLIIERTGEIVQVRAFNRTIGHAGTSIWVDPNLGIKYKNLNSCSIGIELANAGDAAGDIQGEHLLKGYAGEAVAKHPNGGGSVMWEKYPEAQISSLIAVLKCIHARYNLDDCTGHDNIAPNRKSDPGPLFPWRTVREAIGLKGLPVTHWK